MAVKYGEFKFKSEHGFTGSAGKKTVRGYMRGGPVRKARGGPPDEYEASGPKKDKTIEDIIEETKDIQPPKEKRSTKSTLPPDPTPSEERMMQQIMDRTRGGVDSLKKGGMAKMAGGVSRGVADQTVANMQRSKQNYAKGGLRMTAPKQVTPKAPVKLPQPKMPAAMAVPAAPKPHVAPSLASIAAGRNPAMMMGQMKKGGMTKIGKVMHEFKAGELHSGSKKGPAVKSRKQAIAIALSEARKGKK